MIILKSKVTEGVRIYVQKQRGYKMGIGPSGRRYRRQNAEITQPTGKFYGKVFYEEEREYTGDWGGGPETKRSVVEVTVADIPASEDRALVERRTKIILDALVRDQQQLELEEWHRNAMKEVADRRLADEEAEALSRDISLAG